MKNVPLPRRLLLLLALALLMFLVGFGLQTQLAPRLEEKRLTLTEKKNKLSTQIKHWQEDAKAAKALAQTVEASEIEKYLAAADRSSLARRLEPIAASAHLSHFTFTLSPETMWEGDKQFPNLKNIVQSLLVFEAQAPDDTSFFTFWNALTQVAGRVDLESLEISRLPNEKLGDANVFIKASILWRANGSETEGEP